MIAVVAVLVLVLLSLSVIESAVSQLSILTLRVLADKEGNSDSLLASIASDRRQFLVPIHYGIQLLLVLLAVFVTVLLYEKGVSSPTVYSSIAMLIVVTVFRQMIPSWLTHGRSERLLLALLPSFTWVYRVLWGMSLPILALWRGLRRARSRSPGSEEEEATEEEIQAYLGVGEEEGIFERGESRLIQSALEFGNTLVREIMTPRNEIVAIEEGASMGQLRDLIVNSKHSRVPVYRKRMDQIVGIVYVRNLLAHLENSKEAEPITGMISEVLIVPETKRVSELLKEMQARADQMAIVVNEYGTVSGLVTIEDLLEEIVGDIRDEDEFRRVDVVYEGQGDYIVRGSVEVEELEEALGIDLQGHDAATVSGLVVDYLGAVPTPGERVDLDGLHLQILSSDRKRIHTMRICLEDASGEVSVARAGDLVE